MKQSLAFHGLARSTARVGSALTLFQVKNYAEDFITALEGKPIVDSDEVEDETVAIVAEEMQQTTEDFILKELARHLKGHALEAFVANLLRPWAIGL